MTAPSHQCDGCGAVLGSVDEMDRQSATSGRSWTCTYCGTAVPAIVAEKLSHRRNESATDRET